MTRKRKSSAQILARYDVAANGCWEWTGSLNKFGYGQVCVTPTPGYHTIKGAHRLAYEHHIGPIPDGLVVMHKCDNRRCINPEHLQVGTQAENLDDAWLKGRVPNRPAPRPPAPPEPSKAKRPYRPPTIIALRYKDGLELLAKMKRAA